MVFNKKGFVSLVVAVSLLASSNIVSAFSKSFYDDTSIDTIESTQTTFSDAPSKDSTRADEAPITRDPVEPISIPITGDMLPIKDSTPIAPPLDDSKIKPNLFQGFEKILFLGGGENLNVLATGRNDVFASSDMFSWSLISPHDPATTAKWSPRFSPETFYFNNKFWVIGDWAPGAGFPVNDVWSSPDGISWTLMTSNPPFKTYKEYRTATLGDKMYVIGGYNQSGGQTASVWSSSDGINWTTVTTTAAFNTIYRHMSFAFNGKLYVAGGHNFTTGTSLAGTLWSSTDGAIWVHEVNNLPQVSGGGKALAYNNKAYLIGVRSLQNPTGGLNVWSSSDGNTWSFANNLSVPILSSQFPNAAVAAGKLWYGSYNYMSSQNELYSSIDGTAWVKSCASLPWSIRYSEFNSLVSNGGGSSNLPDPCAPPAPICAIDPSLLATPLVVDLSSGVFPLTWGTTGCGKVTVEINSGYYTRRYELSPSGTMDLAVPTIPPMADKSVDVTLFASGGGKITSYNKTIPVANVPRPASNQCPVVVAATPSPVAGGQSFTLSWSAPKGCIVYVDKVTPNMTFTHIFKAGGSYFEAVDSVIQVASGSAAYYVSAQAGSGNAMVLSASPITIVVN